jgi:penicillin-binding protein 1A
MTTEFGGKPVFGGTYPALIWHDFMLGAMGVEAARANHVKPGAGTTTEGGVPTESTSSSENGAASTSGTKHTHEGGETKGGETEGREPGGGGAHVEQAPATPAPAPTPSPATPATPAPGNTPAPKSEGATGGVSPGA